MGMSGDPRVELNIGHKVVAYKCCAAEGGDNFTVGNVQHVSWPEVVAFAQAILAADAEWREQKQAARTKAVQQFIATSAKPGDRARLAEGGTDDR